MQVYATDKSGVWTGESREVGHKDGRHRHEVPHDPPALTGNQVAQWRGHVWVVLDDYPIREKRRDKVAALATRRWQAEEGGTTLGGNPLATDRTTQGKITAAFVKAAADPAYGIGAWKSGPGVFSTLNAATIIAAADAIEAHIQACFANEATLSAQIEAATNETELAAVDIESGWP